MASSRPATNRSTVDLPQPDGPRSTSNSPGGTWSESESTATTSPKRFVTSIELDRCCLYRGECRHDLRGLEPLEPAVVARYGLVSCARRLCEGGARQMRR